MHAFCSQRGLVLPRIWLGDWWQAEPAATYARAQAGEPALAEAWAAGKTMSLEQAVALIEMDPAQS